jgi:glycosyltransferase involved in cell wall biosynthesis
MDHSPKISIVLPTYNGSKFIRTSIESCLRQTFTDFELIIVNDCSTDDTKIIIEEYVRQDNRVRIIHNEYNKKLPLTLNAGFDTAIGRFHTWTSDDNYYSQDALEVLFHELTSNNFIDLVYADYCLIDDSNRITGTKKFNNVYEGFTGWRGCGACFLYKKEIYQSNRGYNPSAFLIEDYDFFMRAFLKFNFKYLPVSKLYYYREHPASLTAVHSDAVSDLQKIMVERQMEPLTKKLPRRQLALLFRKYAVYYSVQKNNIGKYQLYLNKTWKLSKKQALITLFYVPVKKVFQAIIVSLSGIYGLIKDE